MKISIKEIRELIRSLIQEQKYGINLLDDESYNQESIIVPKDIKDKINKWLKDMKMYDN
jgi:hypothetical protein